MSGKYDDIIDLPHHTSENRQHITMEMRAAQFSPFAALTGLDDELAETARITEGFRELSEDERDVIDGKMNILRAELSSRPEYSFTFFVPDENKNGGKYETVSGRVKKIEDVTRKIVLTDGRRISVDMLTGMEKCENWHLI